MWVRPPASSISTRAKRLKGNHFSLLHCGTIASFWLRFSGSFHHWKEGNLAHVRAWFCLWMNEYKHVHCFSPHYNILHIMWVHPPASSISTRAKRLKGNHFSLLLHGTIPSFWLRLSGSFHHWKEGNLAHVRGWFCVWKAPAAASTRDTKHNGGGGGGEKRTEGSFSPEKERRREREKAPSFLPSFLPSFH